MGGAALAATKGALRTMESGDTAHSLSSDESSFLTQTLLPKYELP
jgi:hypothetical protein